MQNYFRSSVKLAITAGLFLGYGSAFASERIEPVSLNELETSLANEPFRAPLPSRDESFIDVENAYVEKDRIREFLNGQKVRELINMDGVPQGNFLGNQNFAPSIYPLRLLKDSPGQGKLRKAKKDPMAKENTKV